jgi:hypothetical protein
MGNEDKTPAPARLAATYRQLTASAANLNNETDELVKAVSVVDTAIASLHLGIECWVRFDGFEDPEGYCESHEIGYAQVNDEWGIALRIISGMAGNAEAKEIEKWRFQNAPRHLRIDCVEALPDLLAKLNKKTDSATKKVKEAAQQAREFGAAIFSAVPDVSISKKNTGGAQ